MLQTSQECFALLVVKAYVYTEMTDSSERSAATGETCTDIMFSGVRMLFAS